MAISLGGYDTTDGGSPIGTIAGMGAGVSDTLVFTNGQTWARSGFTGVTAIAYPRAIETAAGVLGLPISSQDSLTGLQNYIRID